MAPRRIGAAMAIEVNQALAAHAQGLLDEAAGRGRRAIDQVQADLDQFARLLVHQVRTQNVREQMVIPVPPAAVVERDDEQVPAIERLQHGLPAVLAGDGVAQRAAQPVQDGGAQQETPDAPGLALQHLFGQVVDHVAVVPRESGDEGDWS